MSKSVINIKVDPEVKTGVQKLAKDFGLPVSSLINAQLKELLRSRSLELSAAPRMTPYLESIIAEVKRTPNDVASFDDLEAMDRYLDSL